MNIPSYPIRGTLAKTEVARFVDHAMAGDPEQIAEIIVHESRAAHYATGRHAPAPMS
jgi:hypothetical protein